VTELVTGIDLVQWQLRSPPAKAASVSPEDTFRGDGPSSRITSEMRRTDSSSTGRSTTSISRADPACAMAASKRGATGLYYDPMLAKLIVQVRTEQAVRRMRRALVDFW
jgi:acetyl/propionyl-CoA carboxylase alpha subunit